MGNVVLVTGGTVRLGAVLAATLRARGWTVLTSSHRADAGADIVADLAADGAADRLWTDACARNGGRPPDALVNNAALFTGDAATLTRVNFDAPKRLIELMAACGGEGAVVNVLDCRVVRRATRDAAGDYERTKCALRDYTRDAAAALLPRLRVNAVAPGPVLAPVAVHEGAGATPLGRPTPDAVAAAVAFLLEARFTTGVILPVDGGQAQGAGGSAA